MSLQVDSTKFSTGLGNFRVTEPNNNNNEPIVLNEKTADVGDFFYSSNKNNNTKIINEENSDVEAKKAKRKKLLITAGIVLGAVAIGVGTYCLTKKISTKPITNVSKTIAGDLPETLAKIDDFDVFKNLKMCKNLSMAEKEVAYNTLMKCGNKDIFLGTLSGDKPMSILSAVQKIDDMSGKPLDILKKLDLGDNIVFVKANHWSDGCYYSFFNDYIINKKSLFDVIKNNKKLYTSRLNLKKNAPIQDIYEALVDMSKKNNGLPDDLLGISLGFPRYDSMIYNIESIANLPKERCSSDYISKLLETFKRNDFPYKTKDKRFLEKLQEAIKNINQENLKDIAIKGSYHDGLYSFINYCDDADELQRIVASTAKFKQTYGIV